MLYESPHVRVEAADGVATLWLEFPGPPVNALTLTRLAAFDRALDAVLPNPHVEVLVIRSGKPAGFCGGLGVSLETEDDRSAFALAGQRVLNRLAAAECVTVAFLEGPCLGPGLELALACDYRLAVSGPDAWLGFPGALPCWGGSARLGRKAARLLAPGRRSSILFPPPLWGRVRVGGKASQELTSLPPKGRGTPHPGPPPQGGRGEDRSVVVTAREAWELGLVDDAFCARRAKVELRGWLDRLLARPRKRRRLVPPDALALERAAFRHAGPFAAANHPVPCPTLPGAVEVRGENATAAQLVVELAIRGGTVVTSFPAPSFEEALRRGRVTPLEADQARQRIRSSGDATWVLACDSDSLRIVKPRTPPPDLVAWLQSLGFAVAFGRGHPSSTPVRWRHAHVAEEARPALARGA